MDMPSLSPSCAGIKKNDDIYIDFKPDGQGIRIELCSTVEPLYGRHIKAVIEETLRSLRVENATVYAEDYGAMDFAIRARVETAFQRAGGEVR